MSFNLRFVVIGLGLLLSYGSLLAQDKPWYVPQHVALRGGVSWLYQDVHDPNGVLVDLWSPITGASLTLVGHAQGRLRGLAGLSYQALYIGHDLHDQYPPGGGSSGLGAMWTGHLGVGLDLVRRRGLRLPLTGALGLRRGTLTVGPSGVSSQVVPLDTANGVLVIVQRDEVLRRWQPTLHMGIGAEVQFWATRVWLVANLGATVGLGGPLARADIEYLETGAPTSQFGRTELFGHQIEASLGLRVDLFRAPS